MEILGCRAALHFLEPGSEVRRKAVLLRHRTHEVEREQTPTPHNVSNMSGSATSTTRVDKGMQLKRLEPPQFTVKLRTTRNGRPDGDN